MIRRSFIRFLQKKAGKTYRVVFSHFLVGTMSMSTQYEGYLVNQHLNKGINDALSITSTKWCIIRDFLTEYKPDKLVVGHTYISREQHPSLAARAKLFRRKAIPIPEYVLEIDEWNKNVSLLVRYPKADK